MSDNASGPPPVWGGVPSRNRNFTGRDAMLAKMATQLADGQRLVVTSTLGGAGKSQLAVEYVYRHYDEYDVVWWVPSTDVTTIRASLGELARVLGVGTDAKLALRALVDGVPARRWLLVFDDASNPREIAPYVPVTAGHAVRTLEGVAVDTDTLALWMILLLRWPAIADVLQRAPEAVLGIVEPLWCSDHFPAELQATARSSDLRAVVTHHAGGPLTANAIRDCCGVT